METEILNQGTLRANFLRGIEEAVLLQKIKEDTNPDVEETLRRDLIKELLLGKLRIA